VNDVLYMLGTKKNVLSIGVITNMGCVMIFGKISYCIMIVFTPHKIIATSQKDLTNLQSQLYKKSHKTYPHC
jgi:hypothetical protein